VPTKAFNQAVKRNAERFPEDFCFLLTLEEAEGVRRSRSQFVTLKRGQNIKYLPHAFTEHAAILKRLAEIDKTLLEHDSALRTVWTKLQPLLLPPADPPKRRIGFK